MFHLRNGSRHFTVEVLRDLLSRLEEERCACTIHVSDGFSERILYFTDGEIQLLSLGERSGPDVPGYLLERGRIDWPALEVVRKEARNQEKTLLDMLLQNGLLAPEEEEQLSRKLLRNEIFDLVFWEESSFRIIQAPPPGEFFQPHQPLVSSKVSYTQLGEDLASWIKTWSLYKLTLHGDTSRLTIKEAGRDSLARETGPTGTILAACKNGIRLRKLWRSLEMDLVELCERLVQLVETGWLSVTPVAQMTVVGTLDKAIKVLEEILQRAIGKELVREKLVNLYHRAKMPDKACEHLQVIADEMARRGDWETACESLREVLSLKPENAATLQQVVKLLSSHGSQDKARAVAFEAAQALLKQKKASELRAVAGILDSLPDALLLTQEVRADLSFLGGAMGRAASEYVTAANRYEEAGDIERAKHSIAKAITCAPDNEGLKKRMADLKRSSGGSKQGLKLARRQNAGAGRTSQHKRVCNHPVARLLVGLGAVAAGALVAFSGIFPLGSRSEAETEMDRALGKAAADSAAAPRTGTSHGQNANGSRTRSAAGPATGAPSQPSGKKPAIQLTVPGGGPAPRTGGVGPRDPTSAPPGANPGAAASDAPANQPAGDRQPIEIPLEGRAGLDSRETFVLDESTGRKDPAPPPRTERVEDGGAAGGANTQDANIISTETPPSIPDHGEAVAPASPRAPGEMKDKDLLALFDVARGPPPKRCKRDGTHWPRTLRLAPDRWVRYAPSCDLTLEDPGTDQVQAKLEGKEGLRWAVDPRAEVICAWQPGEKAVLYTDPFPTARDKKPVKRVTSWVVPAGTDALAAGRDALALRAGSVTRVVNSDGTVIASGELIPWEEGFIAGASLAFAGTPEGPDAARQIIVVSRATLQPLKMLTTGGEAANK